MTSVKIKVFRNGDRNHFGKQFVINRRYIHTFDDVLQTINEHGDFCTRRVKRLCTPTCGTEVRSIDSLKNMQNYIAVDVAGNFQLLSLVTFIVDRIKYLSIFRIYVIQCDKRVLVYLERDGDQNVLEIDRIDYICGDCACMFKFGEKRIL